MIGDEFECPKCGYVFDVEMNRVTYILYSTHAVEE